ncbi:SacI homology domain-containing protein [Phascolomyces articulosus]|uniref:SacI homology domain-containing protein n=1 Tax=Phascolomyces articulosus TaxID=60185 RepID=A0AAD5K5Y8_9FUNG|nr:SacI homology domain-containing protein [Phascolomyces articulosus]
MNPDAQFFNETQHSLNEEYIATNIPEPTKKQQQQTNPSLASDNNNTNNDTNSTTGKNDDDNVKDVPGFTNYRFVMSSFELYETKTRYYLVGTNQSRQKYRVLQIHRNNPKELVVIEDDVTYSETEKTRLLNMIEYGNMSVGGLQLVPMRIHGIVGFIRFTQGWYMIFITNVKQVALIGGHYVYHIDETRLVPIGPQVKVDKNSDEARYIATFQNIDLTKNFYFSYTYDITNTLQVNMTGPPPSMDTNNNVNPEEHDKENNHSTSENTSVAHNDMFVWNHYLLKSGFKDLNSRSGWILPLIYGFVDQAKISVLGRNVVITLIARRSRHFAGARFLKRGVNDMGFVANDVETEQIVAEMTTTSFHSTDRLFGNPRYTAYVQHRGSIPLIWTQDPTNMSPKPPIELNVVDPFYTAAALHFENLFIRYGAPIIVLNLIKQKESHKRESILGGEFEQAITYLNQFLSNDKNIKYIAWDMSRASKSNQDVIGYLETVAQQTIDSTGFFHSGPEPYINAMRRSDSDELKRSEGSRQHGVLRTNCIDCLDRTNAAQFLMGKCALGHQLYALGVVSSPKIDFDSDAVNIFTEMYHDHGDTIALQYGGSHLVNTMETYRKINQWTSHPRDMIETIRRFYANAFSDADKQDAINLFLGNFVTEDGQPMLWELNSDYHLHNQDPRTQPTRRDYRKWCSTKVFVPKQKDVDPSALHIPSSLRKPAENPDESDPYHGYWAEYYDPQSLTSFESLFAYNMNGTLKYRFPKVAYSGHTSETELTRELASSLSPFTVRPIPGTRPPAVIKTATDEKETPEETTTQRTKDKWAIENMAKRSLDPQVSNTEQKEYARYTQQFRTVDKLVAVQSDQSATPGGLESFPEYQQYYNYFNRTALDNNHAGLQTHSIDEQVYRTYVDIPRRVAAVQMTRDWSGNARRRYEGYASYLTTGKYPHYHGSQHQRQLMATLQTNVLNATAAAAQAILDTGGVVGGSSGSNNSSNNNGRRKSSTTTTASTSGGGGGTGTIVGEMPSSAQRRFYSISEKTNNLRV